mmetsp:Transcript_9198/g.28678  ORF Transcript_9198/g.28678 Transcript_9198/m.28678 type:complete len:232 (-) Transcript_9198:1997-2692(-)
MQAWGKVSASLGIGPTPRTWAMPCGIPRVRTRRAEQAMAAGQPRARREPRGAPSQAAARRRPRHRPRRRHLRRTPRPRRRGLQRRTAQPRAMHLGQMLPQRGMRASRGASAQRDRTLLTLLLPRKKHPLLTTRLQTRPRRSPRLRIIAWALTPAPSIPSRMIRGSGPLHTAWRAPFRTALSGAWARRPTRLKVPTGREAAARRSGTPSPGRTPWACRGRIAATVARRPRAL